MILSAGLKALIENYRTQLSSEEFEKLKWDIDSALDLFLKDLSQHPPGFERGQRAHVLLENEIAKASNLKPTCHKGCSACCHFEVEITRDDAEV
jgi:hypothetical protein